MDQINNQFQMKFLFCLYLLAYLVHSDYFQQLPVDQQVSKKATHSIESLLQSLKTYLDCSIDDAPRSTKGYGHHRYNSIGNFGLKWSGQYKRNRDRSYYRFTYPISRNVYVSVKDHQKYELYNKLKSVTYYLAQIKKDLVKYNNVIVGANNKVQGKSNVVIGSNNTIEGNMIWVFDSDVEEQGIDDGVLIIENYLIETADIKEILNDPRKVIRCVQKDEKQKQINRWTQKAFSFMRCHG